MLKYYFVVLTMMAEVRCLMFIFALTYLPGKSLHPITAPDRLHRILLCTIASSPALFPVGEVKICPGETRVFTCQVSMDMASNPVLTQIIDWRIHFAAPGLADVQQNYIPSDPQGDVRADYRSEYMFVFNLTSNSALSLVSTLTVTLDSNLNQTSSISTATVTVNCIQQSKSTAVLQIITGSPSPPMSLKQVSVQGSSNEVMLQWNASEAADHYIIIVSGPLVIESGSSYITSNTTVLVPVQYNNQQYNISVVASNCAGNSTPAEIMILTVTSDCGNPIEEVPFMSDWISYTCSASEGSSITIQCSDGLSSNSTLTSVCSSRGKWKQGSVSVTQNLWSTRNASESESGTNLMGFSSPFPQLYVAIITSAITFVLGLLLGIILTLCIMKLHAKSKVIRPATQDQKRVNTQPIYEEVCTQIAEKEHTSPGCKVVDNVAYGPV